MTEPGEPGFPRQYDPYRQQPHPQQPTPQRPDGQPGPRRWIGRAGGAAAGGAAAAKVGFAAKALATLAAVGKLKFALSMLVSVAAYAWFWGWKFAVGFVALILVHELGHVAVLRAQGVKASAPMFIPFMGAFVSVRSPQRSVAAEAVSALAGPALGAAGSYATMLVGHALNSPLLQALAYTGFLINLFNLLPALPLDGGRVAGALHPAVWVAGMIAAVALLVYRPSPVLLFVLIFGAMEAVRRLRAYRSGQTAPYYAIPVQTRYAIATAYVAVAAACFWGMHAAYLPNPR
jgi:Zn-dependent protease